MKSLKVADIIHGALRRFTDGLGQLWCSLADYYIRGGHFEKARDVYEEAIQTVMTVRDFGEVRVSLFLILDYSIYLFIYSLNVSSFVYSRIHCVFKNYVTTFQIYNFLYTLTVEISNSIS